MACSVKTSKEGNIIYLPVLLQGFAVLSDLGLLRGIARNPTHSASPSRYIVAAFDLRLDGIRVY